MTEDRRVSSPGGSRRLEYAPPNLTVVESLSPAAREALGALLVASTQLHLLSRTVVGHLAPETLVHALQGWSDAVGVEACRLAGVVDAAPPADGERLLLAVSIEHHSSLCSSHVCLPGEQLEGCHLDASSRDGALGLGLVDLAVALLLRPPHASEPRGLTQRAALALALQRVLADHEEATAGDSSAAGRVE